MKTFVLSVAALALAAGSAQAQVLKYAGFEASEGYVLGDLFGQNGWTDDGDVANVNSVRAASGTRSISINSSPVASSAWWWPSVNFDTASSANKVIKTSTDMYLATGGSKSANWGIDLYDDNVNRISALWVNSAGLLNYWNGTTTVVTSTAVSYDAWHNIAITVDYNTLTASFLLDNVTIASGVSVSAGITSIFADADYNLQGAGFDTTYFDNYRIEAVPTPGALAVLGLGGLFAGRRRR